MKPLPRHRQAIPAGLAYQQAGRQNKQSSGVRRSIIIGAAVALIVFGCATPDPIRSVVRINLGAEGACGFIIGRNDDLHYILTARHVVRPPIFVVVQTQPSCTQPFMAVPMALTVDAFAPDERQSVSILRIGDRDHDLALLGVRFREQRPWLNLADRARTGEPVMAYGCPAGQKPWWAFGFVTGTALEVFPVGTEGHNATVWPGYSGGPVVSRWSGDVVGMTIGGMYSKWAVVPSVSAMIPAQRLREWLAN